MDLQYLYDLAEEENIEIFNDSMRKASARIIRYEGQDYIFMDYKKIENSIEEKCILAEELGHHYLQALYYFCSPKLIVDRQEYKAKKWRFLHLVTPEKLKELYQNGYTSTYEMEQELEVSEDIIKEAYEYYKENNMF